MSIACHLPHGMSPSLVCVLVLIVGLFAKASLGQDTSPDENTQWAVMLNPEVDPSGFAEQFNVALVGSIPALNVHIFIHQPSDKRSLAAEGDSFTSLVDSIMAIQPNDVEAALAQMSQRSTASSSSSSSSSSPPSRLKKMKKRQIVSHDDVLWVQRQTPLKREKRGYLDATAWELGQIRDPLFPAQWHLQQSSSNDHVSIDVIGAWESGATGSGVTIAICDDGLQWTHPDIAQNYRWEGSWNFNKNNNHSGPSDVRSDWHGTSSGSTAAGRDDGVSCGLGSAFRAGLSAVVILQNGIAATDAIEAAALSHAPEVNHIYSNSWGPSDDGRRKEAPGPLTRAAMTRIIKEGRDGLGGIYVWAAGNGATRTDNCNFDGYANMRTTITIGAVDYRGIKSSYSEPCAALFAVAPSSGSNGGNYQYIIAADLLGSDGIDRTDCNRRFTGTSAACPLTAGVIALLLEVNPKLNWIDIQHVIINSTSRNHAEDPDWVQNGAGRWINHKYGFGLINATRAVQIARGFIEHADLQEESASARQASPITFQGSVAQSSLTITDVSFPVRHVEVYLTAIAPTRIGNLKVTLTSPAGTESVLADSHNDATRAYSDWRFTSMRHWGESPAGVWTLRLTDLSMQANTGGELTKWEIVLWGGHSANYYNLAVPESYEGERPLAVPHSVAEPVHQVQPPQQPLQQPQPPPQPSPSLSPSLSSPPSVELPIANEPILPPAPNTPRADGSVDSGPEITGWIVVIVIVLLLAAAVGGAAIVFAMRRRDDQSGSSKYIPMSEQTQSGGQDEEEEEEEDDGLI